MKLPRVTTILSVLNNPELNKWRGYVGNDEADRICNEAAEIGKAFHKICELKSKNIEFELQDFDDNIIQMYETYKTWINNNIDKIIASELNIQNEKIGYTGTIDFVGQLKGEKRLTLFDIKTSNRFSPTMAIQTAAYQKLYEDEFKEKISKRVIIRIDKKTATIETKIYDNLKFPIHYNTFLGCLIIYNNLNQI